MWVLTYDFENPTEDFLLQIYKLWFGKKVMPVMLLVNKFLHRTLVSLPYESYLRPMLILAFFLGHLNIVNDTATKKLRTNFS